MSDGLTSGVKLPNLVAFAEHVSPFAVSENDPVHIDVFNHGGTDFASERAFGYFVAILGSHGNILRNLGPDIGQIDAWHTDNDL